MTEMHATREAGGQEAPLGEIERIAAEAVVPAAESVDREARFPHEAMTRFKAARLLAAVVPADQGGLGASMSDLASMCTRLGRACASTAMIFAMHQAQLACLVRHRGQ